MPAGLFTISRKITEPSRRHFEISRAKMERREAGQKTQMKAKKNPSLRIGLTQKKVCILLLLLLLLLKYKNLLLQKTFGLRCFADRAGPKSTTTPLFWKSGNFAISTRIFIRIKPDR